MPTEGKVMPSCQDCRLLTAGLRVTEGPHVYLVRELRPDGPAPDTNWYRCLICGTVLSYNENNSPKWR
jgi:hypothetical protein